ncbi:MAG: hypothetical protein MI861_07255, partial [Pirellulales bacterium]|nr:hypothetical protein [Pirellulales bacterium]
KLLRIDLAHEQREADPASASPPIPAWQRHLLSIATALGIGILTGMVISSTNRGAAVDGVALSEEEQDFVRGIRLHQQNLANASQQRAERISELTMTLMEEGPNGKLHRSGQDM